MSFIPTVTCRRCGHQYSAIHRRCPQCGTRRVQQSGRTPAGTPSTVRGTAANSRAAANAKWQLIFGLILVAAVIIAVIVLVSVSLNGENAKPSAVPSAALSVAPADTPEPTLTPTPTPTVAATSLKMYYLTSERTEFQVTVGGQATPITAKVYPLNVTDEIKWSVSDDSILSIKVEDDGTCKVTGVGKGTAKLIAECGGVKSECTVYSR